MFLGALVAQQALHFFLPLAVVAPGPARAAGVLVTAAGIVLHARAWRHFRSRGAPLAALEAPAALVTDGPFRLSRNPMYLAGVLILAGVALLYGTLSPWLVAPGFALLARAAFIEPEERLLTERFGDPYRRYGARVGRWLEVRRLTGGRGAVEFCIHICSRS